jgi:hypothetical protein
MSTKRTLKHEYDPDSRRSFHLYEDVFDEKDEYVYLELQGFDFEAASQVELLDNGVSRVLVKLPQPWAAKMGLINM